MSASWIWIDGLGIHGFVEKKHDKNDQWQLNMYIPEIMGLHNRWNTILMSCFSQLDDCLPEGQSEVG